MTENEYIFLTKQQAMAAVCLDFRQYDPQVLLFSEVIAVLANENITAKREMGQNGIWIKTTGSQKMRWFEGTQLIDFICKLLSQSKPDPVLMASICARVFQTRAIPDKDPATGQAGIRILTGMDGFSCRQCGECCRVLDYHNEVTAEDVAYWEQMGRSDVLDWVGRFHRDGHETVYRIWIKPGTRTFAATCPFLQKLPHENRWICRIHDVKPQICRQYPVSRKHAVMTGCQGMFGVTS